MRYDDGDFHVANTINDGAVIDHLRITIDGTGSHTWAPGDYGLSLAGEAGTGTRGTSRIGHSVI